MPRYEDSPEQANASLNETNEILHKADTALSDAIERQEVIESEMDTADDSQQAVLSERHQALDSEIDGLRQDFNSAEQSHIDNQTFWES